MTRTGSSGIRGRWPDNEAPGRLGAVFNRERTVDAETRLMIYMIGWRKGVTGSAVTEANLANEDFRDGYSEGRDTKTKAYGAACLIYGTTLNPLRDSQDA